MKTWDGIVTADGHSMSATVYYRKPKDGLIEWHGIGRAETEWPTGDIDTNIGRIVVTKVSDTGSGYWVKFGGSEAPKGPLALKMEGKSN